MEAASTNAVEEIPQLFTSRPVKGKLRLLNIPASFAVEEKVSLVNMGRMLRPYIERHGVLPAWVPSSASFILLCPWMEIPEMVAMDDWLQSISDNARQLACKILIPYESMSVTEVKQCFDLLLTAVSDQVEFPLKTADDDIKNALLKLAWQDTYLGQFLALSQMRMGFQEGGLLPLEEIWKRWITKFQDGSYLEWSSIESALPNDPEKFQKRMELAFNRSVKLETNPAPML